MTRIHTTPGTQTIATMTDYTEVSAIDSTGPHHVVDIFWPIRRCRRCGIISVTNIRFRINQCVYEPSDGLDHPG